MMKRISLEPIAEPPPPAKAGLDVEPA